MDAKPTKPAQSAGSIANIHDCATSTIPGVIEPILCLPNGLGLAARFTPPAPPVSTTVPFRALSGDEMRRAAPSIFATRPHASRSERFRAIPTIEVLQGMEKEDFVAVGARQSGIAGRQQDRLHETHDPASPSRQRAKIPGRRRGSRNDLAERKRRNLSPTS